MEYEAKKGTEENENVDDTDLKMETGDKDEDVYSETGREHLVEDDEISADEEGFMEGEDGAHSKCAKCKAVIHENPVEQEVDGEIKWFCSDCAGN